MSNETTHPVLKWILIRVIVFSLCIVGALYLIGTYPDGEYYAMCELQKRGFKFDYEWPGNNTRKYAIRVWGNDRNITEDDSRLIGQLSHLQSLAFYRCDLSGLNLDDIANCRDLRRFYCTDVTTFPIGEIGKLAACPMTWIGINHARLNDSDLEDFAKWTNLIYLYLDENAGITDAGFEHLEKIASLRKLGLKGTSVTQEGVEEFKKKRPDVTVVFEMTVPPWLGGNNF